MRILSTDGAGKIFHHCWVGHLVWCGSYLPFCQEIPSSFWLFSEHPRADERAWTTQIWGYSVHLQTGLSFYCFLVYLKFVRNISRAKNVYGLGLITLKLLFYGFGSSDLNFSHVMLFLQNIKPILKYYGPFLFLRYRRISRISLKNWFLAEQRDLSCKRARATRYEVPFFLLFDFLRYVCKLMV